MNELFIVVNARTLEGANSILKVTNDFSEAKKIYDKDQHARCIFEVVRKVDVCVLCNQEIKKMKQIKEGKVKKGGVNNPPTTPRPAPPKGQGGKKMQVKKETNESAPVIEGFIESFIHAVPSQTPAKMVMVLNGVRKGSDKEEYILNKMRSMEFGKIIFKD
jgi:hypothetical protein